MRILFLLTGLAASSKLERIVVAQQCAVDLGTVETCHTQHHAC